MEKENRRSKEFKSLFQVYIRRNTYKNLAYLLFLFPLGIISFVIVFSMIAISGSFLASPFIMPFSELSIGGTLIITSIPLKIAVSVGLFIIGFFLLTISLYLFNFIAYLYKKMLNSF